MKTRLISLLVTSLLAVAAVPLSAQELSFPQYTGSEQHSDERHDARQPWVIGTHAYGVFRAHASDSTHDKDERGYRFNHHPNLVYWKDYYWINYQGGPTDDSEGKTPRVPYWITYSTNGRQWEAPEILFPSIQFMGENTYMHSRMGFYVATDGRLLAISFHGRHPSPNKGGEHGVVRVVREIYGVKNDRRVDMGPVYAIRFNADRNPANTGLKLYTASEDAGFVAACQELLNNPLVTQQWYEEDRRPELYTVTQDTPKTGPSAEEENFEAKAFDWYTLPDGRIIGWWKGAAMASSKDGWKTTDSVNINYGRLSENRSAKMWGQRLGDRSYALVYNTGTKIPDSKSEHAYTRTPMLAIASPDGLHYDQDRAVVFGDVAPTRYPNPPDVGGLNDNRDSGPQYVRGISETNRNQPNTDEPTGNLWLAYSVNKQDIWVSEVPVDFRHEATTYPQDDFQDYEPGGRLGDWIVISPYWAPVALQAEGGNQFVRLQDQDPYDYAKLMRVFPSSASATISFRIRPHQNNHGTLEVDVTDRQGHVAARLRWSEQGKLAASDGDSITSVGAYTPNEWLEIALTANAGQQTYSLSINGDKKLTAARFHEEAAPVERLELRTGPYRMDDFSRLGAWPDYPKTALPNPDTPVSNAIFDLDDLTITAAGS